MYVEFSLIQQRCHLHCKYMIEYCIYIFFFIRDAVYLIYSFYNVKIKNLYQSFNYIPGHYELIPKKCKGYLKWRLRKLEKIMKRYQRNQEGLRGSKKIRRDTRELIRAPRKLEGIPENRRGKPRKLEMMLTN